MFVDIDPGTFSGSASICGLALIADLGNMPSPDAVGELSMLELFLAGGAASGIPSLYGLTPDVDLDGDLDIAVCGKDGAPSPEAAERS